MVPIPTGLMLQLTAVFHVPATLAVSCRISEGPSVAVGGVTETVIVGWRVMVAVAEPPFAIRVTVCGVLMKAGAV